MPEVSIRPMLPDDVPIAERISDDAFYDVDVRTCRAGDPGPERRSPERSSRWIARTRRFIETDPGGSWVAEDETGVVGFATSVVRERLWLLITFAMRPGRQGEGIGKRLLDAAEEYGTACDRGMLAASDDPLALRRYHQAGFALHPQLSFRATVDHSLVRRSTVFATVPTTTSNGWTTSIGRCAADHTAPTTPRFGRWGA